VLGNLCTALALACLLLLLLVPLAADVRESEAHTAVGAEVKKMGNRNATVRNLRVREDTAK
jgi:hypothetical protein